jgi:hypothetical protein
MLCNHHKSPGQSIQEQERKNNLGQKERPPPSTSSSDRFQTRGIDWLHSCTTLQWALYSSCDSLINSDGTLTYEGNRALTCIRNGALLAAGDGLSSIQLDLIIGGLQNLEGPTRCAGVVN